MLEGPVVYFWTQLANLYTRAATWLAANHITGPESGLLWVLSKAWGLYVKLCRFVFGFLPPHEAIPFPPVSTLPKTIAALAMFDRVFPFLYLFILLGILASIRVATWFLAGLTWFGKRTENVKEVFLEWL